MEKTMIKEVRGKITCVHHWLIDAKNHGVCIKCGEEHQFPVLGDLDYRGSMCEAIQRARKKQLALEIEST